MKSNDVNINISSNGGETKETFITKTTHHVMTSIAHAEWKKIFKVYFVTFFFLITGIALFFAYNIARDREILSRTAERVMRERSEENLRDFYVTPKIQHELGKLVYTVNAERAFLFELHNGKKNTTGLPFRFADMTYEEVNEDRAQDKVAMKFQNIPLTLYKYPHYLQKEKMILGNIREIGEVDPDFANHIREVGGVYLGMIYINSNGAPLGFLCVSYHNMNNVPERGVIENKLKEYAKTIGQLLDLQVQMNKDNVK